MGVVKKSLETKCISSSYSFVGIFLCSSLLPRKRQLTQRVWVATATPCGLRNWLVQCYCEVSMNLIGCSYGSHKLHSHFLSQIGESFSFLHDAEKLLLHTWFMKAKVMFFLPRLDGCCMIERLWWLPSLVNYLEIKFSSSGANFLPSVVIVLFVSLVA